MNRASIVVILVGSLLAVGTASAQLPNPFRRGPDDKREQKKDEKNVANYDQLKQYSIDKYKNDADFQDDVNQRFEDVMRQHSDRAYEKNTQRKSRMWMIHEDNWRVHEQLYDNLRLQDLINRIGQRMVPERSERLFAFKVTPDPIPSSETLSTGTIYISTGMISMLDNESQLAYVLAHEMAHVELEHWKEMVMMEVGTEEREANRQKNIRRWTLLGGIGGGTLGGILGGGFNDAAGGALLGGVGGYIAGNLLNRRLIVDWDRVQEDQADEIAFRAVLSSNYDVREVPNLYIAMEKLVTRDNRVALGFLGSRRRVAQRREKAKNLIDTVHRTDIEAKLKGNLMRAQAPEYTNVIAELKRDNGVMAYYHDMFELSRKNLADAVAIRDNDPAAHYFYGKVLRLTGRTPEDEKAAIAEFVKAKASDYRQQNYGASLHAALSLMESSTPGQNREQIAKELDEYVTNYAKWQAEYWNTRLFPPNLDAIFEYMRLYGNPDWRPTPPDLKDMPSFQQYYVRFSPDWQGSVAPPAAGGSASQRSDPVVPPPPGTIQEQVREKVQNIIAPKPPVRKALPVTKK